jgi:hypothetical protein
LIRHAQTKHAHAQHDVGISNPAFAASSEMLQVLVAGNCITGAPVLSMILIVTVESSDIGVLVINLT